MKSNILNRILEPKERDVIHWHILESLSLDNTAIRMGVSRTKVTKIKKEALEKLKKNPDVRKYFEDFFTDN